MTDTRATNNGGSGGARSEGEVEVTSGDHPEAFKSASNFFGKEYRMQEKLKSVHIDRKKGCLIYPTTEHWCCIKQGKHSGNNRYVVVTSRGCRLKCHDDECKDTDLPLVPLTTFPQTLRNFYADIFTSHVDKELMQHAMTECEGNIRRHFSEEKTLVTTAFDNILITNAHHQHCKYCRSGRMQFEHSSQGWNLCCLNCERPWPSHHIPLPREDFPKLFAVLTRLQQCADGTSVINHSGYVGRFESDGLILHDDPEINTKMVAGLQGTDMPLSALVFALFRDQFHCCQAGTNGTDGDWYQYINHHWKNRAELEFRHAIGWTLTEYFEKAMLHYDRSPIRTADTKRKAKHIGGVIEQIGDFWRRKRIVNDAINRFHKYRPDFAAQLDRSNMIALTNGVVDLNNMEFRNGRPEDMLSIQLEVPYQPMDQQSADCVFVMQFMSDIQPNIETRDYLLTVLSLCLSTHTKLQLFWILSGRGANGKSKLMNFVMAALGELLGTAPASLLTRRREDAHRANESLSGLEKTRMAVFSEGSACEILQAATVKLFCGEDAITTRGLREKQRKWLPLFKCFLVCNDIPKLNENTEATQRRVKVIEFTTTFVDNPRKANERQRDPDIGEKLAKRAPALIAILVEYFRRFLRDGLREPADVTAASSRFQTDNDIFAVFKDTVLEEDAGRVLNVTDAQEAFRRWALANGHRLPNRIKDLLEENLGALSQRPVHDSILQKSVRGWKGWKLKRTPFRESRGERLVKMHLNHRHVSFRTQHTFPACYHKNVLPFDFFINHDGKVGCIEFQGRQHYEPVSVFGGQPAFDEQVLRDGIKRRYCAQTGIPLLAIPYTDIDRVPIIVDTFLSELGICLTQAEPNHSEEQKVDGPSNMDDETL